MCLEGGDPGILFPEQLDVERFPELMNEKVNVAIEEIFEK